MDNLCWQKIIVVNSYPWCLLARKQLTTFCNCNSVRYIVGFGTLFSEGLAVVGPPFDNH